MNSIKEQLKLRKKESDILERQMQIRFDENKRRQENTLQEIKREIQKMSKNNR